jgi:electron transfer flavoprotein beta subunit
MKKVVVCYKWVLSDADIRVNEKTHELNMEKCKFQINEYDRNALACGVKIKKSTDCELVGVTAGASVAASAKDALSRGPDQLYYVEDASLAETDKNGSSKVLAAIVGKIGEVDAVVCSEGSSDDYAQQTGPRLAALLGWPSVSYVSGLAVSGDTFTLERKLEDGLEVVSITAPVVISVSPEVGEAPIPSVKDVLGAKKKAANAVSLGELGFSAEVLKPAAKCLSILAPATDRRKIHLNPEGTGLDAAAARLVKELSAAGIL